MVHSAEGEAKICQVTKMEEVKLQKEWVSFGHGDVPQAGCRDKTNQVLLCHLYLVSEDVNVKGVAVVAY